MRNNKTTKIVVAGLLLAMEIILTRFLSINTTFLRLGFGFLPIAMLAILYGPIWAGVTYAIGDVIGAILFPSGPFFPGFTLSAVLTGAVFGLILYKHEITWKRSLLASCVVVLFIDLLLNTCWLSILFGQAYLILIPTRIIKVAFAIPVETILIKLVWDRIFSVGKLKSILAN